MQCSRSLSRGPRLLALAATGGMLWLAAATTAPAQGPVGPGGTGAMPFSNISRRPTMSPYLALGFQGNNPDTGGTLGAMQGIVRPQQQQFLQQQAALRQSRQLNQMQGQLRQIQRAPGGTTYQTIRATGHASTFMELSHFYPAAR